VPEFLSALLLLACLLALAAGCSTAADLPRTVVWSTRLEGGTMNPIPYPTAQAPDRLVVGSGKAVALLDARGKVLWSYDLGNNLGGIPSCGDIDGDGKVEIVACTTFGRVAALSPEGKPKWTRELGHDFSDMANVVLSPRAGERGLDVLVGCKDGYLFCLDGAGKQRWAFRIAEPGHISSPAAADLNGDGQIEFVSGIDAQRVIAVTADGHLLWEFEHPEEFGREFAVVADADRNGVPEIYILRAGATSMVFALDGPTGKLRWSQPLEAKCYCAVTVADINGDGQDEVLAGTKFGTVHAYTNAGQPLWTAQVGGNGIFTSPAVADVDGNGALEIVVGVRQSDINGNSLFVLDTAGKVLGSYPQEGDANCASTVADLDRDGLLEVINCSNKTVFAYHFGPGGKGPALWSCYRANAWGNGSLLPVPRAVGKQVPVAAPAGRLLPATISPILGDTTFAARVPGAATPGYLEVSLTDPQGARLTQAFRLAEGNDEVTVTLPFAHTGNYEIAARLLDTGRRLVIAQESRKLAYTALAAESRLVKEALARLDRASSAMPPAAPLCAELQRRGSALQAAFASLEARYRAVPATAPIPRDVLLAAAGLRARVAREERYADFAQGGAKPEMLLAAWPDANPWDYADPRDELPAAPAAAVTLSAWAYGNQKEDFALNLVGLGPEPFDVRVDPEDLVGPGEAKAPWDQHLDLLQVVWMPSRYSDVPVPDMLPRLNAGRTVQVAPGAFAQLWLVVDTKDLAPGKWSAKIHLQPLTMTAAPCDVTLDLEVLPVALPYPYPWKMCNWAWPSSFPEPLRTKVVENLISHGSNVMYAPNPTRQCDAQGNLVGTVDWSDLDRLIAVAKPGDPFFYFGSLSLQAPEGMSQDSPEWKRAYRAWMAEFVDHLASRGITRRDYAFYPVDEPGNSGHTGIEQLIAAAKVLREADPQAPIYADPAGGAYTLDWIKELDPWVDVWQPSRGLSDRPDFHAVMASRGRRVWMYDAPGNVRVLDPLGFYRRQPWIALRDGAEGSGFWVYYYHNLWDVGLTKEPEYGTVMIDRGEVVDSRRWRAAHDGVQDVVAAILLQRAIAEAEKAGVPAAVVEQGRQALATAFQEITGGTDEPVLDWNVLCRNRRALADALLALNKALGK